MTGEALRGSVRRLASAGLSLHPLVLAALFVLLVVASAAIIAGLPHRGFVTELTVGGGVIDDTDKLRDLRLVPFLIAVQAALVPLLVFGRFGLPRVAKAGFVVLLLWCAIEVAMSPERREMLLLVAGLGGAAALAVVTAGERWQDLGGHLVVAAAGIALALHHAAGVDPLRSFCLGLLAAGALSRLHSDSLARWISPGAALAVAGAVILSAPSVWYTARPGTSLSLLDFLHGAAGLGVAALALRMMRPQSTRVPKAPDFVVAMALFILAAPAIGAPVLPTDDYHFGEKLLAAQATFEQGGWFIDFFSPHGLSDAAGALFAWLLGDFTGTGIDSGDGLSVWYLLAPLAWCLVSRLGALPAAALTLVLSTNWVFLYANLVLGLEAVALGSPFVAGLIGVAVAGAGVFLNAGQGAAAALVIAAAGAILHLGRGRTTFFAFAAGSACAALVAGALFWRQILGQLHFMATSADTNLLIYGNGTWSTVRDNPEAFLFALPILGLVLLYPQLDKIPSRGARFWLVAGAMAPLAVFALVINSYAAARLDGSAPRALIASLAALVVLPVWIAIFVRRGDAGARAAAMSALAIVAITASPGNLGFGGSLLPPARLDAAPQIDPVLPRLGGGTSDPTHVARLREVAAVVEAILEPDETFLDLTNRSSLAFYLDRRRPVPIASPYNAAPAAFQRDTLDAVQSDPPPLALVDVDSILHDGLSLPLRSHAIYDFLLETYDPFVRGNHVYGIRKDLADRLERLAPPPAAAPDPDRAYRIPPTSDDGWRAGTAVGEAAADWSFLVPPGLSGVLQRGDRLTFQDGSLRIVSRVDGDRVRVEPTIEPEGDEPTSPAAFTVGDRTKPVSSAWTAAFPSPHLFRIPSAWGRSVESLAAVVEPTDVSLVSVSTADTTLTDTASTSTALGTTDQTWTFVPDRPFLPARAGLLRLSASCLGTGAEPHLEVIWRTEPAPDAPTISLTFIASYPLNLVPLDSTPMWSQLAEVSELRVRVVNPADCPHLQLDDVALFRRKPADRFAD